MSFGVALAVGALGCLLIAVASAFAGRPRRVALRAVAALGWLWAAGVVGLTFGTRSGGGQAVNVELLDVTNSADVVDFLLNTLMFVPGGIFLAVVRGGFRRACAAGFLASLTIEATQYLTASGRTADVNDLLANTAGCAAGYLVAATLRDLFSRRVKAPFASHF
ncbi:VanZ family protein [Streptomyces sp. NPDC018045]|uniref:VanZ family protein n=1 Tax=Streptomyces sp. NPDC018045 TaxID=3365037 RepID=UPI003791C312